MSNTKTTIIDAMNAYFDAKAGKTPDRNTKHTPGEWIINDQDPLAVECDGKIIATAKTEGDARIIAASPHMLEVLTTLYTTMKINGLNGGHWKEHVEAMKTAIKKATE